MAPAIMAPAVIAALIGAATSAVQGIAGAVQKNKASQLESQYPRPEATMSPYIKKLMQYTYGRTFDQDVPGGEKYRNEIKGATSSGIKAASELGSGSEAYGMLGRIVGGEQSAFAEQGKTVAQMVMGARDQYSNVLAGPANQEWQRMDYWNNQLPYLQAAEAARSLNESGGQNIMAALKNIGGVATAAIAPDMYSSLFSKGGKGGGMMFTKEQLQQLQEQLQELIKKGITQKPEGNGN